MTKTKNDNKKQNKKKPFVGNKFFKGGKKLQGDEPALGSNVFKYKRLNNLNQYTQTLEAIISLIGRTYKQPREIITSIREKSKVTITPPSLPAYEDETAGSDADKRAARAVNRVEDIRYVEALKEYNKKEAQLKENIQSAFHLVWGQCTILMQSQLKTMVGYKNMRKNFELFELIKEIKAQTFELTDRTYPHQSIWDSYALVFTLKQGKDEFLDQYQERVIVTVEAAEGYGCVFGTEEALWKTDDIYKGLTDDEKKEDDNIKNVTKQSRERLILYGFINGLNDRFDKYKKELKANYSQGINKYKATVVAAYQMTLDCMRIYQNTKKKIFTPKNKIKNKSEDENEKDNEGMSFGQDGNEVKACFKCGAPDYKTCACDNLKNVRKREQQKSAENLLMLANEEISEEELGFSFHQIKMEYGKISKKVTDYCANAMPKRMDKIILMDSGSTVDLFCNKNLVRDIRKEKRQCKISTNGGIVYTNLVANLPGYGEVWFHKDSITNLLSLSKVKQKF